jgi:hypothetical protein
MNKETNKNIRNSLPITTSRPSTSKATIIKKLDYTNKKDETYNKIADFFHNPDTYFDITDEIMINKPVTGPKFDKNDKVISYSVVGDPNLYEKKDTKNVITLNKVSESSRPITGMVRGSINYAVVDKLKLNDIIDKTKERISSGKILDNKIFELENRKSIAKDNFKKQEKILDNRLKTRLQSANLANRLSKKVNKGNDDLLMNRTDAFRYKKQLLDLIDNNKKYDEKFGDNSWAIGLRRPKNLDRIRTAYINVGSNDNPVWDRVLEKPTKKVEIIQRPSTGCVQDMNNFYRNKYLQDTFKKIHVDVKKVEGIGNIDIVGKNLLEEEYKKINKLNKEKVLIYKDINDDMQKMTQVFAENYDDNEYLKKHNFGIK